MLLARVEYEFFEFEEVSPEAVELDRQIRLIGRDGVSTYISWTAERSHSADDPAYSIGHQDRSYFAVDPAAVVDASGSAKWSRLVGARVALSYLDPLHFVLEVAGEHGVVFCSAADEDIVRVTSRRPSWMDAG